MPSAPEPENRSSTLMPATSGRMLKSASRTFSEVGRVSAPGGARSTLPPRLPPTIRICPRIYRLLFVLAPVLRYDYDAYGGEPCGLAYRHGSCRGHRAACRAPRGQPRVDLRRAREPGRSGLGGG